MSRDVKKKSSKKTVTKEVVAAATSDKKTTTKRAKKIIEESSPIQKRTTKRTTSIDSKIDSKKKKTDDKPPVNETKSNLTEINFGLDDKVFNYKIASWNVAGLRAWIKKDGLEYIHYEKPDILCLQVRFSSWFSLRILFLLFFFLYFNYLSRKQSVMWTNCQKRRNMYLVIIRIGIAIKVDMLE